MGNVVDVSLRDLNDCGCCAGLSVETPETLYNRPGLSAIAYRVGIHGQFKASMLARLSSLADALPETPELKAALARLQTRDDDDFSIALLDAWATVADVLTFYQERIANESYLRTATERLSLLQLARLIGYELRPGVAASAYLAFTMEDAPGAPGQTIINVGTKVQSLPGPGELPQTFETIEALNARAEWNTLEPVRTVKAHPRRGDIAIDLQGVTTGLKEGDGLLLVDESRRNDPTSQNWNFRLVTKVESDPTHGRTHVTLDSALGSYFVDPGSFPHLKIYAMRKRAALFGANAPDPRTLPDRVPDKYDSKPSPGNPDWTFSISNPINLDASYPSITASSQASDGTALDSWLVLSQPVSDFIFIPLSARHEQAGHSILFGGIEHLPILNFFPASLALYRVLSVSESAPMDYALTSKTTQIHLDALPDDQVLQDFVNPRKVVVFAQSEQLELADLPLQTAITGDTLHLARPVNGLSKGQRVIVSGKKMGAQTSDPLQSEISTIKVLMGDDTLILQDALVNSYDPATITIYANVVLATHGESVADEVLGNGDASQPYQQFLLRQAPLTYISAPTPSGAASTLTVRVNNVEWHEVPDFYGHAPRERIFITRTDNDGKARVEFGDGRTGARLPAGQENVRATYRKGIGLGGMVKAGQLSLLMTRPLGVKSVTNPQPSSGAQDPETLEAARQNAPLTVLTLDRVVSLQDYEDFARAFAGIAKAQATWTWSGQVRGVFITVAGSEGAAVSASSTTYANLLAALRAAGDPYVSLTVRSYRPMTFQVAALIKIDPDYEKDQVKASVELSLHRQFSFASRALGQPVRESEVIAAIQNVAGVIAVDLQALYRSDMWPSLQPALLAAAPLAGADGSVAAAELLTLDPGPLNYLGDML